MVMGRLIGRSKSQMFVLDGERKIVEEMSFLSEYEIN
jgi:hypothetical protein